MAASGYTQTQFAGYFSVFKIVVDRDKSVASVASRFQEKVARVGQHSHKLYKCAAEIYPDAESRKLSLRCFQSKWTSLRLSVEPSELGMREAQ